MSDPSKELAAPDTLTEDMHYRRCQTGRCEHANDVGCLAAAYERGRTRLQEGRQLAHPDHLHRLRRNRPPSRTASRRKEMTIDEELAALDKRCTELIAEADAEFDADDPTCGRCGTSMRLDDMAEWEEDPRANVCNDCAVSFYVAFYDEVPKLVAEVWLLRTAIKETIGGRMGRVGLLRADRKLGQP